MMGLIYRNDGLEERRRTAAMTRSTESSPELFANDPPKPSTTCSSSTSTSTSASTPRPTPTPRLYSSNPPRSSAFSSIPPQRSNGPFSSMSSSHLHLDHQQYYDGDGGQTPRPFASTSNHTLDPLPISIPIPIPNDHDQHSDKATSTSSSAAPVPASAGPSRLPTPKTTTTTRKKKQPIPGKQIGTPSQPRPLPFVYLDLNRVMLSDRSSFETTENRSLLLRFGEREVTIFQIEQGTALRPQDRLSQCQHRQIWTGRLASPQEQLKIIAIILQVENDENSVQTGSKASIAIVKTSHFKLDQIFCHIDTRQHVGFDWFNFQCRVKDRIKRYASTFGLQTSVSEQAAWPIPTIPGKPVWDVAQHSWYDPHDSRTWSPRFPPLESPEWQNFLKTKAEKDTQAEGAQASSNIQLRNQSELTPVTISTTITNNTIVVPTTGAEAEDRIQQEEAAQFNAAEESVGPSPPLREAPPSNVPSGSQSTEPMMVDVVDVTGVSHEQRSISSKAPSIKTRGKKTPLKAGDRHHHPLQSEGISKRGGGRGKVRGQGRNASGCSITQIPVIEVPQHAQPAPGPSLLPNFVSRLEFDHYVRTTSHALLSLHALLAERLAPPVQQALPVTQDPSLAQKAEVESLRSQLLNEQRRNQLAKTEIDRLKEQVLQQQAELERRKEEVDENVTLVATVNRLEEQIKVASSSEGLGGMMIALGVVQDHALLDQIAREI